MTELLFLVREGQADTWKAGGYLLWGSAQVAAGKDFKFFLCSSSSFCTLGKHPPSTSTLDCQVSVDNYYSYTTSELLYEYPAKAFKCRFFREKKKKSQAFLMTQQGAFCIGILGQPLLLAESLPCAIY